MEFNFINIITAISLFQSTMLAVVFALKGKVNKSNYLFSALFFVYTLQILFSLSINYYSYLKFTPYFKSFRLIYITALLIAPILYFIVIQYYERKLPPFKKIFYHFIPFVVLTSVLIAGQIYDEALLSLNFIRFTIIIQSIVYIVITFRYLHKHSINVRGVFKGQLENFEDLIKLILIAYVILWIINVQIFGIIKIYTLADWCAYVSSLYALVMFAFITSLLFLQMLNPKINLIKYAGTTLNENETQEVIRKVREYIIDNKNYRDFNLSLQQVSTNTSIPAKHISRAINDLLHMNFNDYINCHRIEEAKDLLINDPDENLTITEVLYKVGFGSKSSFYTAFKRHTHTTPVEFRKKCVLNRDSGNI